MRLYTVDEANEALPKVRGLVRELRDALEAARFAVEQADDLRRMFGPNIEAQDHPENAGLRRLGAEAADGQAAVERVLSKLAGLGVEVKDPIVGLVDFYSERGDQTVYLCWKEGEERVAHWHTLDGGFGRRRPL